MRRARRSGYSATMGTLLVTFAVALWIGTNSAAHAAPLTVHEPMQDVPETGQAGLLSLTSSFLPLEIPWLQPGDTFSWQIGLHLKDQAVADGTLEFIPYGGLMQPRAGYRLTAQRCESQWSGQSGTRGELKCASGATVLLADSPLQSGPTAQIPFGDVAASTSPHILFTLSLPEGGAAAGPFAFALGFTVMGDEASRRSELPETGFAVAGALATGVALLGAGLFAKVTGRRAAKS
ncbi:hypothetical protein [Arthrobacter sp.]|uniref:hypothetical protein n=1 Tax=Arthrobacter sp. TaxID=1667 RepID=UPI0028118B4B|nr:hypothetical protein [Arthrobacter sp.]